MTLPANTEKNENSVPEKAGRIALPTVLPDGMTLESIIDLTGEMEHLNNLVMLYLDRNGGFTCNSAYFDIVRPLLDDLETEIRFQFTPGMSPEEMRNIISFWIDTEISSLQ